MYTVKKMVFTTFLFLPSFINLWTQIETNTKLSGEPDYFRKETSAFLIANQSNAGGIAIFSPKTNVKADMQDKHPTNPGIYRRIIALKEKNEKMPNANDIELTGEQLLELRKEWGPFVGPWQRYSKNPVIGLEDKETYSIQNGSQSVIKWQGQWYMFLMTSQPMVTKLAVSDDGLTWKRPHHNYLLKPEMDWEGSYNLAKVALVRDDEVWLYYFGKKDKRECIGLARSRDLVNWKKQTQPIFTSDDSHINGTRAFPECVIKEGDLWYMYYDVGWDYYHPVHPDNYLIGVAISRDGITWTDSPKSPVLTPSKCTADSWDDGMVSQCSVHKIGDWYYMLYSGSTNKYGRQHAGKNRMAFGLARSKSPEGPWEKYPHNPVFKPTGNEQDFDGVFLQHPCPVKEEGQWRMYYNGWTKKEDAKNTIGAEYAIGVAFTSDTETTDADK